MLERKGSIGDWNQGALGTEESWDYGISKGYHLFPSQQAKVVPNNDKDRTYAVSYVPKVAGLHKVTLGALLPY